MPGNKPLMEFDDAGEAPVLRYDIPAPSAYQGANYVRLDLPQALFSALAQTAPTYADFLASNEDTIAEYLKAATRTELEAQLCSYNLDKAHQTTTFGGGSVARVEGRVSGGELKKGAKVADPVLAKEASALAWGKGKYADTFSRIRKEEDKKEEPKPGDDEVDTLPARYELFRTLVQAAIGEGKFPVLQRTMGKKVRLRFVRVPLRPEPRLLFVETYKMTTFPGDYGAGNTVQTFSLLPGEETKIFIKTWKKSATAISEASSILDSYTEEKADEFERGVQSENASASKSEESFSYHAEAKAEGSWGVGSAEVSGAVAGSSSSSREESSKNVLNATSKHAQSASAKREINVDTSYSRTDETGSEQTIDRVIKNVNVSRTLNFAFRQLNQEFHTVLHLVNVRVAFSNGYPGSTREYPLYQLSKLVSDCMVPAFAQQGIVTAPQGLVADAAGNFSTLEYVEALALGEYAAVYDHQGSSKALVERAPLPQAGKTYLRVIPPGKRLNNQNVLVEQGRQSIEIREAVPAAAGGVAKAAVTRSVDGIIIGVQKQTMRTSGLIVEALLGKGDALDKYAKDTQDQVLRSRRLENDRIEEVVRKIVAMPNAKEAAEAFANAFNPRPPRP